MEMPQKDDWFIQWLETKFAALEALIQGNKTEHDKHRDELHTFINTVDQKHDAKHKNTRWLFLGTLLLASAIFIKESRDFIIHALKIFL